MSYYDKILQPGEELLFKGKLHWLIYLQGLVLTFFGIATLAIAILDGLPALALVAILLLLVAALVLCSQGIRRVTTEIVVTNRRVIYKRGWISRQTPEMNTSKIETVDVLQGVAGRVLGFGTVLIRGTGSTFEPLTRIADPLSLRNAILTG